MPRTTAAERLAHARRMGFQEGYEEAKRQLSGQHQVKELREAQIKLINSVGQAMSVQSQMLQGLMQVFDNGPR